MCDNYESYFDVEGVELLGSALDESVAWIKVELAEGLVYLAVKETEAEEVARMLRKTGVELLRWALVGEVKG